MARVDDTVRTRSTGPLGERTAPSVLEHGGQEFEFTEGFQSKQFAVARKRNIEQAGGEAIAVKFDPPRKQALGTKEAYGVYESVRSRAKRTDDLFDIDL